MTTRLSPKSGTAGEIARSKTDGESLTGLTVTLKVIALLRPPLPSLTFAETVRLPLKFGSG